MSTLLQSPLLRKIVFLYGNAGIQLSPYSLRHLRGCGNLTVNLILNIAIFYNMITTQQFASRHLIDQLKNAKPFFNIVFLLFVHGFYPICTLFTMIHYFLYGPVMMACLDSPLLRQPYEGKSRPYFTLLMVLNFVMFLAVNVGNINNYFKDKNEGEFSLCETLYNFIMLYLLSLIRYFQTFVLHYCLHGTYHSLLALHEQLINSNDQENAVKSAVISKFIDLALVNKQIYHLVSLQMIIFYSLSSVNVLIISYIALLIANKYTIFIFPMIKIFYVLYLVGLNRKVQTLAAMIVNELKISKIDAKKKHIKVHHFQSPSSVNNPNPALRYKEIEIYQRCFQLKAFNLTKLNRKFMFATGLLILNYTIFIYQTQ